MGNGLSPLRPAGTQWSLLSLEHVIFADVLLEKGLAIAAYDPERVTADDLMMAVASAGKDGRHNYRARVVGQVPAAQALLPLPDEPGN